MRQITKEAVSAFIAGTKLNKANMRVFHDADGSHMLLHGNPVGFKDIAGNYWISNAGWPTVTTKERLNGLIEVLGKSKGLEPRAMGKAKIFQKDFEWYWKETNESFPHNEFVRI